MKKAKLKIYYSKNYKFIWFPIFIKKKLMWKDKFETPRCEIAPYFRFEWLWFEIYGVWENDSYWEQWLWVYKYHNGNVKEAKQTWPWIDGKTKQSTWKDY